MFDLITRRKVCAKRSTGSPPAKCLLIARTRLCAFLLRGCRFFLRAGVRPRSRLSSNSPQSPGYGTLFGKQSSDGPGAVAHLSSLVACGVDYLQVSQAGSSSTQTCLCCTFQSLAVPIRSQRSTQTRARVCSISCVSGRDTLGGLQQEEEEDVCVRVCVCASRGTPGLLMLHCSPVAVSYLIVRFVTVRITH